MADIISPYYMAHMIWGDIISYKYIIDQEIWFPELQSIIEFLK